MELFWFLLGLAIGLLLLSWHHVQLNLKLKKLIHQLRPDTLQGSLSSTARLTRAIAVYGQRHQDLVEELNTWQHILQAAPIGFLQIDDENQLIWCNQQAGSLLGIQQYQQSKPRLLLELVRSYELDQLIEQTRTTHHSCQCDWTFYPVSADPTTLSRQQPRFLRAYGTPLTNGRVGVFLESRQEAVLLAQQRDRWISDVAHELKTPLTSIRLVAETLQMRLTPPLRDWLDRLLNETVRLSCLVQDLLDLSRLEAKPTPELALKTIDLPQLIQSTWSNLEPLARRKHLQLDYRGPSQLLLQADESKLHRVLLNLLDNSIKYSPVHQFIRVQLSLQQTNEPAQQIHLEVIDAGPGFPEHALTYVFERFYRVDPSRTRNPVDLDNNDPLQGNTEQVAITSSGSGLGLAIVRQIVEAHQGYVKAGNHPETQGAWLQVFLPQSASVASA